MTTFMKWLRRFQEENLVGCCAQTDVKGKQNPETWPTKGSGCLCPCRGEEGDGIVVRGCKTHITIAPQADEVLVIPTPGSPSR